MKKTLCLLALALWAAARSCPAAAQGVQPVNSKYTRYQLERQVLTRWGKFKPKWYFVLFHNKYRKGPDRRNLWQLAPTMAFLAQTREKAQDQEEAARRLHAQELFKFADRTLNKGYHLIYKKQIRELNAALTSLALEAAGAGVPAASVQALLAEQERLNTDIGLVLEAYQDDARKGKALRAYLSRLEALRSCFRRLISLYRTQRALTQAGHA
ncbi:hypothetical protein [Pontibacter mangrovi]|uniref:DUF5045 domain-containing protein n=1 Tax=Pontibacter mangrovi TaxID=2589816 RepID=A0A501VTK2_9BACT|nr:hypothetical protein [Pontibacter mangrovi]TPE39715.1 hypothetical protein FJM65_20735 [Pontibacter mangrovi]